MYTIYRKVRFAAAHRLTKFPEDHKCYRPHGHSYKVEVWIRSSELMQGDVLLDYGEIDSCIRGKFDHQNLNYFPEFDDNPTAERIAEVIYGLLLGRMAWLRNIGDIRVRVWEEEHSYAEYNGVP